MVPALREQRVFVREDPAPAPAVHRWERPPGTKRAGRWRSLERVAARGRGRRCASLSRRACREQVWPSPLALCRGERSPTLCAPPAFSHRAGAGLRAEAGAGAAAGMARPCARVAGTTRRRHG